MKSQLYQRNSSKFNYFDIKQLKNQNKCCFKSNPEKKRKNPRENLSTEFNSVQRNSGGKYLMPNKTSTQNITQKK